MDRLDMDTDKRKDGVTRREFLIQAAAGTAALGLAGNVFAETDTPAPASMPTRVLGKTGAKVSVLGFGGGSRFLVATEEVCDAMLEHAIKAGITYFDTASIYGKERASEKRYGRI